MAKLNIILRIILFIPVLILYLFAATLFAVVEATKKLIWG